MAKYQVNWTALQEYRIEATVEAESEEEAIEKAKVGDTEDEDEQFVHGVETNNYDAVLMEDDELGKVDEPAEI
jgi:hypothetical protein